MIQINNWMKEHKELLTNLLATLFLCVTVYLFVLNFVCAIVVSFIGMVVVLLNSKKI